MRRLRSRASFDYTKQENTPTKSWNPLRRFNVAAACIGFAILLAFLSLISEVAEVIEKEKLPFQHEGTKNYLWGVEGAEKYVGCSNASANYHEPVKGNSSNGFLMIQLSGGLNQQRVGIVNAVVLARMLNATLVVPKMDNESYWNDTSKFEDVFNLPHFISSLKGDVKVVKNLPKWLRSKKIYRKLVPRYSNYSFYMHSVLPKLQRVKVLELTKFDFRLSQWLPAPFQKLRCRVNYHALRFSENIEEMGKLAVRKMKAKGGAFLAIHLRYEPDMLAFTGCYYGGGRKELEEFQEIRKRWENLPKFVDPLEERRKGKCPLNPAEIGIFLQALGYKHQTNLYIASGDIYGGKNSMAPLHSLFPRISRKESLLSQKELENISGFSSRMAALDYYVSLESDIFVANNNGNMARLLGGHRRYLGHRKTIRPNSSKIAELMMLRMQISKKEFIQRVRYVQAGYMGEPVVLYRKNEDFFENPRLCLCKLDQFKEDIDDLEIDQK